MATICNVIHFKSKETQDLLLSTSQLLELAVLADKYDVTAVLSGHVSLWIDSKISSEEAVFCPAFFKLAYVFHLPSHFQTMTRDLIIHYTGSFIDLRRNYDKNGTMPADFFGM